MYAEINNRNNDITRLVLQTKAITQRILSPALGGFKPAKDMDVFSFILHLIDTKSRQTFKSIIKQ